MLVDDTTPFFPFVPRAYVPCVLSPTTLQCSVEHPRPSRELSSWTKIFTYLTILILIDTYRELSFCSLQHHAKRPK